MLNLTTAERKRRRRRRGNAPAPPASSQPAVSAGNSKIRPGETIHPIDIASPFKRLYAFGVDILLIYVMMIITKRIFGDAIWSVNAAPQDLIILFGYFVLPTGLFGRTPGKWVAGLRVVDVDGRNPGVALAIPREMIGRFIATIAAGIGLAWVVFDPKRQGWHDKIAGTLVINTPNSGGTGFLRRWFKIDTK
jgi:uncharacterized RDD family membrane protein YckC